MFNMFVSGFCASTCMYSFAQGKTFVGMLNLALALLNLTIALTYGN